MPTITLTADNSYITLDEANAYHADRGTPAWLNAADDEARKAGCVRATDYIATNYILAPEIDTTHPNVKLAALQLAPYAISAPLISPADAPVASGTLDGVASTTYFDSGAFDPYPFVSAVLQTYASRKIGGSFKAAKATL